eukprot:6190966-Prymnesium_polylepis.1
MGRQPWCLAPAASAHRRPPLHDARRAGYLCAQREEGWCVSAQSGSDPEDEKLPWPMVQRAPSATRFQPATLALSEASSHQPGFTA